MSTLVSLYRPLIQLGMAPHSTSVHDPLCVLGAATGGVEEDLAANYQFMVQFRWR
jgi:hypothetical protein